MIRLHLWLKCFLSALKHEVVNRESSFHTDPRPTGSGLFTHHPVVHFTLRWLTSCVVPPWAWISLFFPALPHLSMFLVMIITWEERELAESSA